MSLDGSEMSVVEEMFNILIATDIHLGYAEHDPERGMDSFNTFEEILQLARSNEVDFILLGGDLFHDNKPSPFCLHKCIKLLRKYCMGDKPVAFQFLSDQNENFRHLTINDEDANVTVNYVDPNINISIPIFSIHGNHDDPSGSVQLSSLDILSATGLVNYFGKWTDLTEINITPILLSKGSTKLAIYGLSYIKDERLSRLFRDQKVKMFRPQQDTDSWFNIFVCHQNRADRGINKHLREEALPDFLQFVVWGHEHECRINPEQNSIQSFFVTQPGSPIATSLCEGEAKQKHVALLKVITANGNKKSWKLTPIPLKTVRPFNFETIVLSECNLTTKDDSASNNVQYYLEERIEFWIKESRKQLTGHPRQPTLPLLRVRVEYNNETQCFNTIRFGQQFQSKVANPTDMILLRREKVVCKKKPLSKDNKEAMDELLQTQDSDDMWEIRMNAIIEKYFAEKAAEQLKVISIKGISEAAARFIDKQDREAIRDIVKHQIKKTENYLLNKQVDVDHIDEEIEHYRLFRLQNSQQEVEEVRQLIGDRIPQSVNEQTERADINDDSDENDDLDNFDITPARGRGGSRARGGRPARSRASSLSRTRGGRRGGQNSTTSRQQSSRNVSNTTIMNQTRSPPVTRRGLIYDSDSS